jgi:hypothetical protein
MSQLFELGVSSLYMDAKVLLVDDNLRGTNCPCINAFNVVSLVTKLHAMLNYLLTDPRTYIP